MQGSIDVQCCNYVAQTIASVKEVESEQVNDDQLLLSLLINHHVLELLFFLFLLYPEHPIIILFLLHLTTLLLDDLFLVTLPDIPQLLRVHLEVLAFPLPVVCRIC